MYLGRFSYSIKNSNPVINGIFRSKKIRSGVLSESLLRAFKIYKSVCYRGHRMICYKFNFAKNQIITCHILEDGEQMILRDNQYHYTENGGHLIFAIIKAPTIEQAHIMVAEIIQDVKA